MQSSSHPTIICFGENTWNVVPAGTQPGGLPVDACIHFNRHAIDSRLVTRIGLDDAGKQLITLLESFAIPTDYIQMDYELPTFSSSTDGRPQIGRSDKDELAWDHIIWDESFERLASASSYLLYTTHSCRSRDTRNTLFSFFDQGLKRIVQGGLYSGLGSKSDICYCLEGAFMAVFSVDELELITGWVHSSWTPADRARIIQDRFQIPMVIVMYDAGGLIVEQGNVYAHHGYRGTQIDEVGTMSAFTSGFVIKALAGKSSQQSLDYACALRCKVASLPGASSTYLPQDIENIIHEKSLR